MLPRRRMIVAALGFVESSSQDSNRRGAGGGLYPPHEAVTTNRGTVHRTSGVYADEIGTVAAVRGVTVSADLQDLSAAWLRVGQAVRDGRVLAMLDPEAGPRQLAARRRARRVAHVNSIAWKAADRGVVSKASSIGHG